MAAPPQERPRALPCVLDTNALSELVRNPHGTLAQKLNALDPDMVCTSIVACSISPATKCGTAWSARSIHWSMAMRWSSEGFFRTQ